MIDQAGGKHGEENEEGSICWEKNIGTIHEGELPSIWERWFYVLENHPAINPSDGKTTMVAEVGGAVRVLTGTIRDGEFDAEFTVEPLRTYEVLDAMEGYGHTDELAAKWRAKMLAVTAEQIEECWAAEDDAAMHGDDAKTCTVSEKELAHRRAVIEGIKAGEGH